MKVRTVVVFAVLALAGGQAAIAQVQPPQERINTVLARARQVGVPVALLESKIAEGKAKGVSLDRIAAAVERRQAALERASQVLRGGADSAMSLSVGADAIESGVSDAVLKAVADSTPGDRRTVAIAALTELVKQGHAPEAALNRVRDAVKRGPDALSKLPAEAAAVRRGPEGGQSGRGNGRGGTGGESGPPAAVPAPGKPPEAGRPEGAGGGNTNRPSDPGGPAGGGPPTNPGRGGR